MQVIMNLGIHLRFTCLAVCALAAPSCSTANPYAGPVPRTIEAFVPPEAQVHGEYFKEFEVDGEVVRLTFVQYGLRRDCPSGCFSSNLCAIEDDDEVLLYFANWYGPEEEPLQVDAQCPDNPDGYSTTNYCEAAGKSHPLASTEEFREFAEAQYGTGTFRFCVSYLVQDCLASLCMP
jgi:hypothetical protein